MFEALRYARMREAAFVSQPASDMEVPVPFYLQ